jgi:hypothetical protein
MSSEWQVAQINARLHASQGEDWLTAFFFATDFTDYTVFLDADSAD